MRGAATTAPSGRPGGSEGRSDLSRLARGGLINLVGAVANGVLGFVLILVVTRGLAPGPAGVFFEAIALFQILNNVTQLGADDGLVRSIPRLRALARTRDLRRTVILAVGPVMLVAAAVGALAIGFAPQLSRLVVRSHRHPEVGTMLVPYIRLMMPFLPLAAASSVLLSGTRGFGTMIPTVAVDNVAKPGLRPVGVAVVLAVGAGSAGLALSWSVLIAVGFVVALVWLILLLRRVERSVGAPAEAATPSGTLFSEFWRFSSPRGLAAVFSITVYWLDTLLLGALRGTRDAGIYTAASRYVLLGYLALGAVQQAIAPLVARLVTEGNRARAAEVYHTATQWLMTPAWPITLALATYAPAFLRVFRPSYEAGAPALTILAVSMLVSSACGPSSVTLLMAGKSTWALGNSAAGLAVNVGLNLLLIPHLGMTGAAISWAASIAVVNGLTVTEIAVLLKLRPFGPQALTVAIPAVAYFGGLGLLFRFLLGASFPALAAYLVLATGLFALALYRNRRRLRLDELRDALRARGERLAARAEAGLGQPEG